MGEGLRWYVAHTRPRCEKKLGRFCEREGIEHDLPTYKSVRKYARKKVVFEKPLFPGYVFVFMGKNRRRDLLQSDYLANLLEVDNQDLFVRQMADIQKALAAEVEIQLAPTIVRGAQVRVKYGPMAGVEGWVTARQGMTTVLLEVTFIGQAAADKLEAEDLELI